MTTLYLIRHGESQANVDKIFTGQTDVPLSPRGLHQAQLLAKKLVRLPVGAVYASDLLRAVQTVTPAAEALDLPVIRFTRCNYDVKQVEADAGALRKRISELQIAIDRANLTNYIEI